MRLGNIRQFAWILCPIWATGQGETWIETREMLAHNQSRFIADLKTVSDALLPEDDKISQLLRNLNITRCEKVKRIASEGVMDTITRLCTSLNLSHLHLKRLPMDAMALMSNMKELDISGNPDLVILPEDVELLGKHVEKLVMRDSRMDLETLELIMRMPKLTSLDISHNDLSESLMGTGFEFSDSIREHLTELKMSKCKLTSGVFAKIATLKKIQKLDVSRNRLIYPECGSVRIDLMRLKALLIDLDMSHCKLHSEWLDEITGFLGLRRLNLSHNTRLGEKISDSFRMGRLGRTIIELNLAETNISPLVLVRVCECWRLKKLNVSHNPLVFSLVTPQHFKGICGALEWLEAVDTNLNPAAFNTICQCVKLEFLDISGNPGVMNALSYESLRHLRETLVELRVSQTLLTTAAFKEICGFKHIRKLDISNNLGVWHAITMKDFHEFGGRLVGFTASSTGMEASHLSMLSSCVHLKSLDISGNDQVLSQITETVFNSPNNSLDELKVSGVGLKPRELAVVLKSCNSLKKLDISNNSKAMNELPFLHFEAMSDGLVELNASNMALKPLAMMMICQCKRLKVLNISDNDDVLKLITAASFGPLKSSLECLDISRCGVLVYEFDVIKGCRRLKRLIADGNPWMVKGNRGLRFGELKETIEELSLSSCGLRPKDFEEICGFVKLERLNVSRNRGVLDLVTKEELLQLEGTLVELNLRGTTNHYTVVRRISKALPKVRIIH